MCKKILTLLLLMGYIIPITISAQDQRNKIDFESTKKRPNRMPGLKHVDTEPPIEAWVENGYLYIVFDENEGLATISIESATSSHPKQEINVNTSTTLITIPIDCTNGMYIVTIITQEQNEYKGVITNL